MEQRSVSECGRRASRWLSPMVVARSSCQVVLRGCCQSGSSSSRKTGWVLWVVGIMGLRRKGAWGKRGKGERGMLPSSPFLPFSFSMFSCDAFDGDAGGQAVQGAEQLLDGEGFVQHGVWAQIGQGCGGVGGAQNELWIRGG